MSDDSVLLHDHVRVGLGGLGMFASPLGELELSAELVCAGEAKRTIAVDEGERRFCVVGPGDVARLSPTAVLATQPPDRMQEFPYNLFASVDLVEEDLPWRLSPAPGGEALRPWIVLVVVPVGVGLAVTPASDERAAVLQISGAARSYLPDLGRGHLWAHAQVRGGEGHARLVCPTALAPGVQYVAAVVPAFAEGREAGLGREPAERAFAPAWTQAEVEAPNGTIELPALYCWQFRCARLADFAELAEQLRRVAPALREGLGLRAIAVGPVPHASPPEPPDPWEQVPGGALVGTAVTLPLAGTTAQRVWFRAALARGRSGETQRAYDPLRDDPLAAPPDYGQPLRAPGPAAWATTLNEEPALRAMAGLGAEAVRRHQEQVTVALLDRAGELREARTAQRRVVLAAAVALGRVGRMVKLADASLLPAMRFSAVSVAASEGPDKPLPRGSLTAALRRQLRSGSPVGRAIRAAKPDPAVPPAARLVKAFMAAGRTDLRRLREVDPHARMQGAASATLVEAAKAVRLKARPLEALRGAQDPATPLGRAQVWARFAPFCAGLTLRLDAAWTLDLPLAPWLAELDPELLVPGLAGLAEHGVALLAVNPATVEAVLIGANDAVAREIAWRDLPVPRGATLLRRFWAGRGPGGGDDIGDIRGWKPADALGGHVRGGANVVLVLRSPLVRMYPRLAVELVACVGGKPRPERREQALFRGLLDAGTLYAGFPLAAAEARGSGTQDGWFVELRQPAGDPVFGTDVADDGARTLGPVALATVLADALRPAVLARTLLRAPGRAYIHASWLL